MRLLPSKACCVVLAAVTISLAASSAYAGGRGGPIWIPHGRIALPGHPHSGPDNRSNVSNQGSGRWDQPQNGWNNRGRYPCGGGWGVGGGGAGWGHGGGCQGGGYFGGVYGTGSVAPEDVGGGYTAAPIYEAAAYTPPPDPSTSCWVQRLIYDYNGNFVGTHRIDACKIGPKVIDMSTAK